jgi:hypothetical protein
MYFCHEQRKIAEQISDKQIFSDDVQQGYTKQLWIASKEYNKDAIKQVRDFL